MRTLKSVKAVKPEVLPGCFVVTNKGVETTLYTLLISHIPVRLNQAFLSLSLSLSLVFNSEILREKLCNAAVMT